MKQRRSIRLPDYDYAADGAYFVTLLAYQRSHLFGEISDGAMNLSTLGCIAETCWLNIAEHFPGVELDAYVIMPNHMHGIVIINRWTEKPHTMSINSPVRATHASHPDHVSSVKARHAVPLQSVKEKFGKPVPGSLATIIRSYKSAVTRQINQMRQTPGALVWHRNYYEHIIRDEKELNQIREYISCNPARWSEDEYFQ